MTEEEQAVAEINLSFYRAFENLDINQMESIWARKGEVQCGHPGWRILRGRRAVMDSWRSIFENTPAIRFVLTDVSIEVCDDLAWATLYENVDSLVEGQKVSATILTTNIFSKSADGWRMIHHHGSSIVQPPFDEETPLVH